MDKLGDILHRALAKRGLLGVVTSAEVCVLAQDWGKGRFHAVSFSRGVLKLSVSSSPAASEVQMVVGDLIDYLNGKIGRNVVRNVRVMQW